MDHILDGLEEQMRDIIKLIIEDIEEQFASELEISGNSSNKKSPEKLRKIPGEIPGKCPTI